MTPYYTDDAVTLYLGDCRTILPELGGTYDCAVTDPPYGETSLAWDRWPEGWPTLVAARTRSLWCFGSMRMFLERRNEFARWKLSQDVVWEKPRGTSFVTDRFSRVHEHALHWYVGDWSKIHHETPRDEHYGRHVSLPVRKGKTEYVHGRIGQATTWVDDGMRMARSVIGAPNMHMRGEHPTQKPLGILDPLIAYSCPPGGNVLDPFAGSGSTLVAARDSGRRAVGIEADERYCEAIARRLNQASLFSGDAS